MCVCESCLCIMQGAAFGIRWVKARVGMGVISCEGWCYYNRNDEAWIIGWEFIYFM